jgi:hypothetical protein
MKMEVSGRQWCDGVERKEKKKVCRGRDVDGPSDVNDLPHAQMELSCDDSDGTTTRQDFR